MANSNRLSTYCDIMEHNIFLSRDDLVDFQQIEEGQFGPIYKANWRTEHMQIPVALKPMKSQLASEAEISTFLQEMTILKCVQHPNTAQVFGVINEANWIVMEYFPKGDLKNYLIYKKHIVSSLLKYMLDIAMGMHYLSAKGFVHRKLAARNILVSKNQTCKVADIALDSLEYWMDSALTPIKEEGSQDPYNNLRWMAPENLLSHHFSTASDVWSFGVVIWEMFNPSSLPYEECDDKTCVERITQGYVMEVPRECPERVVKILKACWYQKPASRPSFLYMSLLLSSIVLESRPLISSPAGNTALPWQGTHKQPPKFTRSLKLPFDLMSQAKPLPQSDYSIPNRRAKLPPPRSPRVHEVVTEESDYIVPFALKSRAKQPPVKPLPPKVVSDYSVPNGQRKPPPIPIRSPRVHEVVTEEPYIVPFDLKSQPPVKPSLPKVQSHFSTVPNRRAKLPPPIPIRSPRVHEVVTEEADYTVPFDLKSRAKRPPVKPLPPQVESDKVLFDCSVPNRRAKLPPPIPIRSPHVHEVVTEEPDCIVPFDLKSQAKRSSTPEVEFDYSVSNRQAKLPPRIIIMSPHVHDIVKEEPDHIFPDMDIPLEDSHGYRHDSL